MVTRVGNQKYFTEAIKELLELEYDALEAYKAAIGRFEKEMYKLKLQEFQNDHERHIARISNILSNYSKEIPDKPSSKQWLTKGKVVLANLIGDKKIIEAMISNEEDTNQAYENLCKRDDKWSEIEEFLTSAHTDEKRHKAGLKEMISSMP